MKGKYTCPTCWACTMLHTSPHPALESFRLKDFVCSCSLLRILSGGARNTPLYSFPFQLTHLEILWRWPWEAKAVPANVWTLMDQTHLAMGKKKLEWWWGFMFYIHSVAFSLPSRVVAGPQVIQEQLDRRLAREPFPIMTEATKSAQQGGRNMGPLLNHSFSLQSKAWLL